MVESFKDKLGLILRQLEQKFGSVDLFAVLKMDEVTDKWSVLVGAKWVTSEKRVAAFNELVSIMRSELDQEERFSIARIGVLNSDDHLVQLMLTEFRTGEMINGEKKVNGNIIHEGIILKAVSDAQRV